jgi:hypothetical protein
MKNLSIERMETIEGGDVPGCLSAVAGLVAFGFAVALTPATGGTSILLAGALSGALLGGVTTGIGMVQCAD